MAVVRVSNANLGGLSGDMAKIPPTLVRKGATVVRRNARSLHSNAQRIARGSSGRHGLNAYKRLDWESTGALSAEIFWTGNASEIVGAGFRHGAANTDLPTAADIVGPKFAKDVSAEVGKLFW